MSFRDPNKVIAPIAPLVGKDHRGNPGRIDSEGHHQQIRQQLQMLLIRFRNAIGLQHFFCRPAVIFPRSLDPPLKFTDSREILIDFSLIGLANHALQPLCIIDREVENTAAEAKPLRTGPSRLTGSRILEESLEDQPRIPLLWNWLSLTLPGNSRGVGAAIARVTAPIRLATVSTYLKGREPCPPTDHRSSDLVYGNSRLNIGSVSLAGLYTSQKCGHCPGMISGTITVGVRFLLPEPTENAELSPEVLKWLKNRRQLELASF
jgi:hypothetical protein